MGGPTVTIKLTYLVSHPIQYQAPLLRRIANEAGINLRVVFENKFPKNSYYDSEFKRQIKWDIPLTDGYENASLSDTSLRAEICKSDVLWLHGWGSPAMLRALIIARQLNTPVLMRGENCDLAMPDGIGPKGWLKRLYISWILRHCQAFLAIGTENTNYYLQRGVQSSKIFFMPYAIDNDFFAARAAHPQLKKYRAELGIAPSQKMILFAGKFLARKNPDVLVHAINSVDHWHNGKPALVFVGSGEMEEKLRTLAPDAIFLGFKNQSELPLIYSMADVFVLPSEREPWGLAVNEAMACGTAVIVSDQVGCATDLLVDECGKVFPSGNIGALADSLVHCIQNSKEMGLAASSCIKEWGFEKDVEGLKKAANYVRQKYDNRL